MSAPKPHLHASKRVRISCEGTPLEGELVVPAGSKAIVVFAYGSGDSIRSAQKQTVARIMRESELGTLLLDLLTSDEEQIDFLTRRYRFNVDMLSRRLQAAAQFLAELRETRDCALGFFGASNGAAAALRAAAELGDRVGAVVSRSGRLDLARESLGRIVAPTLLIVGARDKAGLMLNRQSLDDLCCEKELAIVSSATHMFEEPDALKEAARLAAQWFTRHLQPETSGGIGNRLEV